MDMSENYNMLSNEYPKYNVQKFCDTDNPTKLFLCSYFVFFTNFLTNFITVDIPRYFDNLSKTNFNDLFSLILKIYYLLAIGYFIYKITKTFNFVVKITK